MKEKVRCASKNKRLYKVFTFGNIQYMDIEQAFDKDCCKLL